jgi:hypothetical protein
MEIREQKSEGSLCVYGAIRVLFSRVLRKPNTIEIAHLHSRVCHLNKLNPFFK